MKTRSMTFVAVMAAALAFSGAAMGQQPSDLKGKPVPSFSWKSVTGQTFSNQSLKGKVVILDFWATWCAPCVAASPTMEALHKKYAKDGLVVIGQNFSDTVPAVKAYIKKHGYTYPFVQGYADYAAKSHFESLPVFLFVDRKGIVQRVDTGFLGTSPAQWEATVKQLLAKK